MARGESLIRQWTLLKALQTRRLGICADELAELLVCSKRQVQRDLNILQRVGFPVSFEQRDFGKRFWKLAPNFLQTGELVFSVTELLSLYLSKQLLTPLSGTHLGDGFTSALDKVKALLPAKALNYFDGLDDTLLVKSTVLKNYSRHDEKISVLNRAILEGIVVNLCYHSLGKKRNYDTQYHPYGLIFFDTNLYCIGFMTEYNEIRTIKIDRIIDAKLSDRTFQRPATFSLQNSVQGSFGIISGDKPQKIQVRLTDWAAAMVREQKYHFSQKLLKDTADMVIAQFELSNTTEFIRWVLSFGKHAVVIQPKSLAQSIAAELRNASILYNANKKS